MRFKRALFAASVLLTLATVLALVAAFVTPRDADRVVAAIPTADLLEYRPIHSPKQPLWFVRRADGGIQVLLDQDTRTGCNLPFHTELEWTAIAGGPYYPWADDAPGGLFRDGRFGSTYNLDGRRIFGPAPSDLAQVTFEETGGRAVVTRAALDDAIRSHPPSVPAPDCR